MSSPAWWSDIKAKVDDLRVETGHVGWNYAHDGHAEAITDTEWDRALSVMWEVSQELPTLPAPMPSPDESGTVVIRWRVLDVGRVDLEIYDDEWRWSAQKKGEPIEQGEIGASTKALVDLLRQKLLLLA